MENSEIAWTDNTFNPWIGCTKVSEGCRDCYAMRGTTARVLRSRGIETWGPQGVRFKTSESYWNQPLKWNRKAERTGKRVKVFCASQADVFEDNDQVYMWRRDLFEMIKITPMIDWLLLTKRPNKVIWFIPQVWLERGLPNNVWIGTTIEDQKAADERLQYMADIPARVKFVSCEPLIGPINFYGSTPFDWCIVGGESGANARPLDVEWARAIKRQCDERKIAFFMKQGSQANWQDFRNFESFPVDLRVMEFPE